MSKTTDRIVAALIRHQAPVLFATALLSLFFGYFILKIQINNDPTKTVPPDLKAQVNYQNLQKVFSSPRTVLLIAQFDSLSLGTKIDSMTSWGERFARIDGIVDMAHLGTMQIPIQGGFIGITGDYLVSRKKKLSDDELRARISDSRELIGLFISEDETTLSMIMGIDESKNQVALVSEVDRVQIEIARTAPARIYVTGAPMYAYQIDRSMRHNFRLLLPLCVLVVFALLYGVFKRLFHVLASLAIITIALVWTFGILGMSGLPFSVVTSIIPVILFPIGVATAIHVFRTHARIRRGQSSPDNAQAISATFRELMKPIFLSAITTFVGFASFGFSAMIWTKVFGIFTSIGVALALLLSIVLLPIALSWQKGAPGPADREMGPEEKRSWLWRSYERFIFDPYQWVIVIALIVAIGILGFLKVRVEGNPIAMFSKQSDIRKSDVIIENHLGGTRFLFILLEHKTEPLLDVKHWSRVQEVVDYAEGFELVGGTSSLLPLIHKVSTMLSDTLVSKPALAMLLKAKGLLGTKFESYMRSWITPDRRSTRIALICKNVEGTEYLELSESLSAYLRANFPEFNVLVAGPPVLNDAMTYVLVDTQKQSMSIAFGAVFIVLCLLFRSLKVGIFAIIPIILSTLFVYALMGFFGVAINVVTVIIVNTCIGIGIDYSIHFTAGYLFMRENYQSRRAALLGTARTKGSVILFNTFVVGIGFLVLGLSNFSPVRDLGMFVFVSMVTSSLFSLMFLPVMFRLFGVGAPDTENPIGS